MAVRHAKPEDVEEIIKLAESLRYNPKKPAPESIVTVLKDEEYLFRIKNSKFFYVNTEKGKINGFLICNDFKLINKISENKMFHHEEILPFLSKIKEPYIYGETIGVKKEFRKEGVGEALMKKLFSELKTSELRKMYIMIRHKPTKNTTSIKFSTDLGFIYTGTEVKHDEFIHGVYEKKIN